MPIINTQDAREVDQQIEQIFDAGSTVDRLEQIRQLFVGILDFDPTFNFSVGLDGARDEVTLPAEAYLVARLDDVQVVYVDMSESEIETDRVNKREAQETARLIESELGDELLLVFTNRKCDQLHFVYPSFEGRQPALRRMVIEKGLPRRTVVQQIANIWAKWQVSGDIRAELDAAFDVEAVTRRFFSEYKRVFGAAMGKIEGFGTDDEELERKNLYVLTLFNRLMFVYFISRKGWLTFEGDNDYLDALWGSYESEESDNGFYESRLRLLFFDGLNKVKEDRDEDSISKIDDVPFFNGGLFYESDLDRRVGVDVPDDAVLPLMMEVFDRFNFTVMESTEFDVEVAVDPEMLGKVFEELVTARHDSGAYYTPRPVVRFMCREALKGYLSARVGAADEATIARFVDERNTKGIGINAAQQIAASLDLVKVVDPACGSGAYLLAMMHELVELHTALFNVGVTSKSIYDLKLKIIRDNLYGADNDDFATNIAMLRLWLSLAIDFEGTIPQPLPNLEFKIVCGDSLLGPDPTPETVGGFSSHLVRELNLVALKARYMEAYDRDDKEALRHEIDAAEDRIREQLGDASVPGGVVDWRVTFAEVFAERKGFDVAVANPPYVRQEKIGTAKPDLRKEYADSTVARSDLYCYFYIRGLQLLRAGGMHVFVCSNSWLDVGYGAKLQEYLLKNARVDTIYESAVERQFSTAQINTIISVISKTEAENDHSTKFVSLRDEFESAIAEASKRREITMIKSDLWDASQVNPVGRGTPKFVGDKWGAKYLRAPDIYRTVMKKGEDKLTRLGDVARVKFGIKTGANDFFYLNQDEITEWAIEGEFLKPAMLSSQESKSIMVNPDDLNLKLFLCHKSKAELTTSAALEYIEYGERRGYNRRRSVSGRHNWYDLGAKIPTTLAVNYQMHSTARTLYVPTGILVSDNFQEIQALNASDNQLCASLNSSITQLFLNVTGRSNFGGGMIKVQTYEWANLPVVDPRLLLGVDIGAFRSEDWDVLKLSPQRRRLDDTIFDVLGFTQGERDGVYEGVRELVEHRTRRARSV